MYEAVRAVPDGESTVARLAATAASSGFDGVVVRNRQDADAEYDPDAIRAAYGVDVARAVEIDVDERARASGYVGHYRPERTVVVVRGGDPSLNRMVAESEAVDVLADPMGGDGDVNHVVVRAAAEHGTRLEVNLAPVLRRSGGARVRALQKLRKLRELLADADAPFVVSARPSSHLEVRAPRELVAVGERIGFSEAGIRDGLAEWGRLVERNRHRRSGEFIAPGVERGRYEEEP